MARAKFWTEDKIAKASKLWNEGMVAEKIAEQFGVSRGSLSGIAACYRDRFPARIKPEAYIPVRMEPKRPVLEIVKPAPPRRTYIAGKWVEHVKRTTISGAVVTMPRVSFIDGGDEE